MNPPDSSRIMMRWWWFGPAATHEEMTAELQQMKAAGIGGVEIANLYALALDDTSTGFRNTPFLSQEHIETLRFAAQEARRLGLRIDVTLGSGWPFGGPTFPLLRLPANFASNRASIESGATSASVPFIDTGRRVDIGIPDHQLCLR